MLAGVIGTVLVIAPRMVAYQGPDPSRADIGDPVVSTTVAVIALVACNMLYMALKEEHEPLHLMLSAVALPLLLTCLVPGYGELFPGFSE